MRQWLMDLTFRTPQPPMAFFPAFLSALPEERRFCIPCLARMYSVSDDAVRRELQTLAARIEISRFARCWTCEETGPTYRLRPSYPAAA